MVYYNSKNICVINNGINSPYIKKIGNKIRANKVVLNNHENFQDVIKCISNHKIEVINYVWNEHDPIEGLHTQSYAFDVVDTISFSIGIIKYSDYSELILMRI